MYVHSTTKLSPYLVPSIFIELYFLMVDMHICSVQFLTILENKWAKVVYYAHVPI